MFGVKKSDVIFLFDWLTHSHTHSLTLSLSVSPSCVVSAVLRFDVGLWDWLVMVVALARMAVSEKTKWRWRGIGVLARCGYRLSTALPLGNRGAHATHHPPRGGSYGLGGGVVRPWAAVDFRKTAVGEFKKNNFMNANAIITQTSQQPKHTV